MLGAIVAVLHCRNARAFFHTHTLAGCVHHQYRKAVQTLNFVRRLAAVRSSASRLIVNHRFLRRRLLFNSAVKNLCGTQLPAVHCFIRTRNIGCRVLAPCRCARASPVPPNTTTPLLIRLLPNADPAILPFTSPRRVRLESGASVTCVQHQSPRLLPADPRLSSSAGVHRPRRSRPPTAPSAPTAAQPTPPARCTVALQHATRRAVWFTALRHAEFGVLHLLPLR